MATTQNSDDGVPVDLESGGGISSAAPRRNTGAAKAKKKPTKDGGADSYTGGALMMLVLYYFFFVFYMVGFSEKWWHAVLGIAVASAFVLLSFCMATCKQDFRTQEESNAVKPTNSDSDLGSRLLESENLEADASTRGAV